jgi:hypothetical protein
MSLQSLPTYEQSLTEKGQTSKVWYRFWSAIYQGTPPANESTLTLNTSPFSYTAQVKGFVLIRGGTVSSVQVTRSVTTLTGLTSGYFPLNQGDVLTITYSGLPSVTWYPR